MARRAQILTIVIYFMATSVLLATTAGSLLLVEEGQRRLVFQLSPWIPGLLWPPSAIAVTVIAYRLPAVWLALSVAGSFLLTTLVLYAWASAVAFVGGGAWDQLRGITGGGLYPMVAVLWFVWIGALLTAIRGTHAQRQRLA